MVYAQSVLEIQAHKILWDFEIQTDHRISARRSDLVRVSKKKGTSQIVPPDHWVKLKETEKKDKYLDLAKELKQTMEHESDRNTNWSAWKELLM